jgi:hypothetical protein
MRSTPFLGRGALEGFMRRHFAWRPHLDRDPLFNPFVPSERRPIVEHIGTDETFNDEAESHENVEASGETEVQEGQSPPRDR